MRWLTAAILMVLLSTAVFASVQDFPAQFVEDNKFDGYIVVTDENGGLDYLATTKLMTRLFEETTVVGAAAAADESKVNFLVNDMNDQDFLEGGEKLVNVVSEITGDQWDALAPGEVTNQEGTYEYSQYMYPGDVQVRHDIATGVPDDPEEVAQAYLDFDAPPSAPAYAYEYKIVFDPAIESDIDGDDEYALEDLEGMEFNMLGKTYIISKTEHAAADDLKLTLVAASEEVTLREGETKTIMLGDQQHEVTVVFVSDPQSGGNVEVKLSFDGEMIKGLERLDSYNINDETTIYVRDVMVNARDAVVDLRFGASKLILHDDNVTDGAYADNEWEIDEEYVDGTDVKIVGQDEGLVDDGKFYLESISVKWVPEDTHYVATGQKLSEVIEDPNQIFGQSFDIGYMGANTENLKVEVIELKSNSDDEYHLYFTNRLGQQIKMPLFYDNSGSFTRFGDDTDELHLREGYNISQNEYFVVTSEDDDSAYTHYLEYEGQDADQNYLEFRDVPSGHVMKVYYEDGATTASLPLWAEEYAITLSDAADNGDIQVDLDNSGTITQNETPTLVTQFGMQMVYDIDGAYAFQRLETISTPKEECLTCGSGIGPDTFLNTVGDTYEQLLESQNLSPTNIVSSPKFEEYRERMRITVEDDSGEIDIADTERCLDGGDIEDQVSTAYDANATVTAAIGGILSENLTTDFLTTCYLYHTTAALTFMLDIDDNTDDDRGTTGYGQKLVLKVDTNGPDDITVYNEENQVEHMVYFYGTALEQPEPVAETKAKLGHVETVLDSDVDVIDRDMIVVGGPCSNSVAASLIGTPDCLLGYEEGMARVVQTEENGHDVLIIAGYDDADTYLAVQALLEQTDKLRGDDLEISGTLDDLVVLDYVEPEGAEPVAPPAEEETPPEEEPAAPAEEIVCEASNDETGLFTYEIKKLGVTKEVESTPRVEADGTSGTVYFTTSAPFEAQLGVDWLQYVVTIHEGDCSGSEVESLTFKWEDGDGDKEQSFSLPSRGCYCMQVAPEGLSIDDAEITMTSDALQVPFSTESAEENAATGNAIYGGWFPARPLNDMDVWK